MDLNQAYDIVNVSQEEVKSVKGYLGHTHTGINLLGNFTPENYENLKNHGWLLPETTEDLKRNIEDFVNIYSAMYKESRGKTANPYLVRGTSNKRLNEFDGKTTTQFLSTSTDENVAKTFTEYGDGALIFFGIADNVPFLDTSNYVSENYKKEHEIILSPFCKANIVYRNQSYDKYSFSKYRVEIEKDNSFKDIDTEQLNSLQQEIIDKFSQNLKDMNDFLILDNKLFSLKRTYYQFEGNKKEQNDIMKIIQENQEKYDTLKTSTTDFKDKLQLLLRGLCRQKELEIDEALKMVDEDKKLKKEDETRKKFISEATSSFKQNTRNSELLQNNVTSTYSALIRCQNKISQFASQFGISMNFNRDVSAEQLVQQIRQNIQTVSEKIQSSNLNQDTSLEDAQKISKDLKPILDGISYGAEVSRGLNDIPKLYIQQLDDEFKGKLYNKVQQVLQTAKINKYSQEKQILQNKKIGFLGKLFGKETLKNEQLTNLDLKIQLAQNPPKSQDKVHIRDLLADMYICAETELNGEFTKEMQDLYKTISSSFSDEKQGEFTLEYIKSIANKKMMKNSNQKSGLPAVQKNLPRFLGKTKAQIDLLRTENSNMKNQLSSVKSSNNFRAEYVQSQNDAFSLFKDRLKSIARYTQFRENIQSRENTEDTLQL